MPITSAPQLLDDREYGAFESLTFHLCAQASLSDPPGQVMAIYLSVDIVV